MMLLIIGMADPEPAGDLLTQMLTEVARSTARLREMADEAYALVQHLQHRPPPVSVKKWANETTRRTAAFDEFSTGRIGC